MQNIFKEIEEERQRQDDRFGEQNHKDGTNESWISQANIVRTNNDQITSSNYKKITWQNILDEEICEAFAETNQSRLREELVQCAAVIVAWLEAIDRRENV